MAKPTCTIGIDLGGTNIQAGLLDASNAVIARDSVKTKAELGGEAVVGRVADVARSVLKKAKISADQVTGIGIGAPGAVDHDTGVVITAVNLRWDNFPLGRLLRDELKMDVVVDNDVNVGAWGAHRAGAGRGFQDLLAVFIGTGIGGGLILGGQLYHGHYRTAGEIGHTVLDVGGTLGRRTLENLASRTAIVNNLTALISANHASIVPELVKNDLSKVRSKVLAQAYKEGDELVQQVIHEAADVVGAAIANVVTMLSLPCVVVGGGLTEALGQPVVDRVVSSFNKSVFPRDLQACKILLSTLGDDAGVVGAAMLARDRLER